MSKELTITNDPMNECFHMKVRCEEHNCTTDTFRTRFTLESSDNPEKTLLDWLTETEGMFDCGCPAFTDKDREWLLRQFGIDPDLTGMTTGQIIDAVNAIPDEGFSREEWEAELRKRRAEPIREACAMIGTAFPEAVTQAILNLQEDVVTSGTVARLCEFPPKDYATMQGILDHSLGVPAVGNAIQAPVGSAVQGMSAEEFDDHLTEFHAEAKRRINEAFGVPVEKIYPPSAELTCPSVVLSFRQAKSAESEVSE